MAKRKRQSGRHRPQAKGGSEAALSLRRYLVAFVAGGVLTAGVWLLVSRETKDVPEPSEPPPPATTGVPLETLLGASPEQLAGQDIAAMNLACAEGLPGAENRNVQGCLTTLDRWARRVKTETDRHLYRFRQNPADFNDSEGYFRMLMLITVLQQDFRVHYNKDRVRDIDFTNSKDLFLHGLLGEERAGTCVSMPVLYVAVARRRGYPVHLVLAKGHVFCRWETPDGSERFNIEGTNKGLNCLPDDHYTSWPHEMPEAEEAIYLESLKPAEELAVFLAARGHCLADTGRLHEAQVAYAEAHRLAPQMREYLGFLAQAVGKELPQPRFAGKRPSRRRHDPLAELREIQALNAHNRRLMERTMPGGVPGPRMPGQVYPPGQGSSTTAPPGYSVAP